MILEFALEAELDIADVDTGSTPVRGTGILKQAKSSAIQRSSRTKNSKKSSLNIVVASLPRASSCGVFWVEWLEVEETTKRWETRRSSAFHFRRRRRRVQRARSWRRWVFVGAEDAVVWDVEVVLSEVLLFGARLAVEDGAEWDVRLEWSVDVDEGYLLLGRVDGDAQRESARDMDVEMLVKTGVSQTSNGEE